MMCLCEYSLEERVRVAKFTILSYMSSSMRSGTEA
jgi:hypothetical protein